MRKVICDVCGTDYSAAESNCPICGSSREFAEDYPGDSIPEEAPAAARKSKEIFDYDEVNHPRASRQSRQDDFDEDLEDEDDYEEESGTNVGLVVVLVILIVLLLLAAGFFFIRYLLPNMIEEPVVPTEAVVVELPPETEATEPQVDGVPCTNLMMDGGRMELGKDGKKLLNVHVYPEDTTDVVLYTSADEAVAVVSADGTVTAVGEGHTVITIQCGSQQIKCNVTVDYTAVEPTEAVGEIPGLQAEGAETATEPAQEGEGTGETQPADATEAAEATEATEAATEPQETQPEEVKLKLKKTDITIPYLRTSVTLALDCDIDPEEVTWFTMDSSIAIVNDGVVTSIGRGMTKIYAEYKGQQVSCIVRCS